MKRTPINDLLIAIIVFLVLLFCIQWVLAKGPEIDKKGEQMEKVVCKYFLK
jgi:hypothetical protein